MFDQIEIRFHSRQDKDSELPDKKHCETSIQRLMRMQNAPGLAQCGGRPRLAALKLTVGLELRDQIKSTDLDLRESNSA